MRIGVILPSVQTQQQQHLDLGAAARHAEDAGLDGVWMGDHLSTGAPTLESTVGLATAAAVTARIRIGISVFIPALRPPVWAAKQIASLQYLSAARLVLGVGSGGGENQWAAAGIPFGERGPRTDRALQLLPDLLAGKPVTLGHEPGSPVVELSPPVPVPPIWVGNDSAVARRRAARFGDGWFPSLIPPEQVATGRIHLAELAETYRRPEVTVTVGGVAALGPASAQAETIAQSISDGYGKPIDEARRIPIAGSVEQAAHRLGEYAEAGVGDVVLGIGGGDWRAQVELLAEVARRAR